MIVKELIAKLQEFDGELEVVIETCCEEQYAENVRADKNQFYSVEKLIISSKEFKTLKKIIKTKGVKICQ